MEIAYKINEPVPVEEVIEVFKSSGITRPVVDVDRIQTMLSYANLIVSAWHSEKLIGISRSLTDFSYCCYLSDLAVKKEYQHIGVGKRMIELTKNHLGNQVMLLLLSVPEAMEYYPKVGFEKADNGFIMKRKR